MSKFKNINELLKSGGPRLGALKVRTAERNVTLGAVRAALPKPLADQVISAGLEQGRLTVGVASAAWASRLRYATAPLRARVAASMGIDIQSVRIRVVPPQG